MTFLEAAIAVLRQVGRPLHVRELTERSIKMNLLSHLGRAPEATMRTRLTQEAKKGSSPIVQKGQEMFGLRQYTIPKGAAKPEPEPEVKKAAPAAAAAASDEEEKKRRRRRGGRGRKRPGAPGAGDEAVAVEEKVGEEPTTEEAVAPPIEPHDIDLDALQPVERPRYPRIVELPGDEVLSEQYADEITGGAVAPAVPGEMVDEKTADEDRPMLAEIKDERDRRGRLRGKERGKERGGKERGGKERGGKKKGDAKVAAEPRAGRAAPAPAPAAPRPPQTPPPVRPPEPPAAEPPHHAEHVHHPAAEPHPVAPPAAPGAAHAAPATAAPPTALTPEGSLADIALALLRSLNDPRPVHARQLAAMALKRKLLSGDLEELWRAIRSALAGDARARQSQGLRIRARHQGGGLFTLTTARLEDEVRSAEDALATVWRDVGRATREALRRRATRLPLGALEQLARTYLDKIGMTGVERVKRAGETWYLSGVVKRGARPIKMLVAVRAGGGELSRHAVGELRAGVQAKHLHEGMILAPSRLDNDGMRELDAAGPTITAFTGDAFAEELEQRGVGVVRTHLPVAYLDIDLLAELSEN